MAQMVMRCPFLTRLPSGFARRAGSSLFTYAESCPVMNQVMQRHASTQQGNIEVAKKMAAGIAFWGQHSKFPQAESKPYLSVVVV